MIGIVLVTQILVSLLCFAVGIHSSLLVEFVKDLSNKIPKLLITSISVLSILETFYTLIMSFILFVIWDVYESFIFYQTLTFLLITCTLLYIFYRASKSIIMIVPSVLWCGLMTFYIIYLFNQFFLLV